MTHSVALWQQLQAKGLVFGDQPIAEYNQQPAFFLRILLGASGWLSALFFTVFISTLFISVFSEISNIWGLGLVLCAISIWISRTPKIPLFLEQFVFACSMAGQTLITFGVLDSSDSSQLAAAALLALEIILFISIGIRSQRAAALFLACGALLWLLGQQTWLYALPVLSAAVIGLWLNNLRVYKGAAYLQPATVGLTLGLWVTIFIILLANSTEFSWWNITQGHWHTHLWITAALTSIVCLGLAWQLIRRSVQHTQLRYIALFISIFIGLVNLKMPGLAPLCLLLCIGVKQAHTRLIWLNLLALAAYFMLYYYSLNSSLLYKSILLCASGAILLIVYTLLNRYARPHITESKTDA
jgi:hypothetical protein